MQEPWDFEAFVKLYDAVARARGGWLYDRKGYTPPEKLEGWYREGGALFGTLKEFAETRYELEQER